MDCFHLTTLLASASSEPGNPRVADDGSIRQVKRMTRDVDQKSRPLLLVPTDLEKRKLLAAPCWSLDEPVELCGFGPIAAAARAAALLSGRGSGVTVWLLGIAGTFDPRRLPLGAATAFGAVTLDGVGIGIGLERKSAGSIGFLHWPGDPNRGIHPIGDRIELERPDGARAAPLLLTAAAASANPAEADQRRVRFGADAEDMEAFGVALACTLAGVRLTVLRGISNQVGDREMGNWKIDDALAAVARLASDLVPGRPNAEKTT